jgi:hypothetical protein
MNDVPVVLGRNWKLVVVAVMLTFFRKPVEPASSIVLSDLGLCSEADRFPVVFVVLEVKLTSAACISPEALVCCNILVEVLVELSAIGSPEVLVGRNSGASVVTDAFMDHAVSLPSGSSAPVSLSCVSGVA